jgi:hypothetical protein
VAWADTPLDKPEAIEIDRAETPAGRTEFSFEAGAPVNEWGATVAFGWLERPIAFGELHPVRRRESVSIGGAIALGTVVFDARVGGAHQIGDRLGIGPLDKFVSTDLRAGVRLHVAGGEQRSVFVRAELSVPTGDDGDFAGEASWSLAWRLVGRLQIERVVLAANAGIRLRGREVTVGDRLVGDEGLFAVGVGVPLPALRPLWCERAMLVTGEIVGVIGDDVGIGKSPSPIEARVGVVGRVTGEWTIGVRGGAGLDDEIGAPRFRATAELTYSR